MFGLARGCVKPPPLKLRVESGSRFRQSEANNSNKYCREKVIEKMILCIRGLSTFSHRLARDRPFEEPARGGADIAERMHRVARREDERSRSDRRFVAIHR